MSIDSVIAADPLLIRSLVCIALVEPEVCHRFPSRPRTVAGTDSVAVVGCCSCCLSFCVGDDTEACESSSASVAACFGLPFEPVIASVGVIASYRHLGSQGPCSEH